MLFITAKHSSAQTVNKKASHYGESMSMLPFAPFIDPNIGLLR
jgi:hypothetical protein